LQIASLFILLNTGWATEGVAPPIPEPIGYVTDYGRVIEPGIERKLASISSELERKTGVRIRVLTVPDLGGQNLDLVAKQLMAAWSETPEVAARSILVIDAMAEKKIRIELGSDIPHLVSDEVSQRVQQQVILPHLARGERGPAYLLAVLELSAAIAMQERVALYSVPGYLKLQPAVHRPATASANGPSELLLFVPLLIFMVGMARLESKMARATVIFGDVFRRKWRGRYRKFCHTT